VAKMRRRTKAKRKPLVFISHKHNDKRIADAFSEWLTNATRGDVNLFQSSDGLRDGPTTGRNLTEQIREAAHKAQGMFVIYTDAEQDWEWVMFEIGICLDPTPETRIALIQCGPEVPDVLRDRLQVVLTDRDSCLRFVKELMTTDFFLGGWSPFAEHSDSHIESLTDDLREKIGEHLPKDISNSTWSPHPTMRLKVTHYDDPELSFVTALRNGTVVADEGKLVARELFDEIDIVGKSLSDLSTKSRDLDHLLAIIGGAMAGSLSESAAGVPIKGREHNYVAYLTQVKKRPFQQSTLLDFHFIRATENQE